MNIFTYLGLPADHRKPAKVTQLVKHFDEVTEKNKVGKKYGIQIKEDGVCAITVIHEGKVEIFSRTGKPFTNTEILKADITNRGFRDGVYFGEMVQSHVSLEVLSGKVNPNRTQPLDEEGMNIVRNLCMRFFDLISIESFIEGASQTVYLKRYKNLVERINKGGAIFGNTRNSPVSVIALKLVDDEHTIDSYHERAVKFGEEGIVICDLAASWEAGHKGYRKMKKVRGCDYDLLCVGYEEGKGKYTGLIANLLFKWKGGETIKCMLGKGWTHQNAKDMFEAAEAAKQGHTIKGIQYSNPVGNIFQVYALEESSKGKLRLPKVGEQRFDKVNPDVK
jgi:ATP-dependent DNA ligase